MSVIRLIKVVAMAPTAGSSGGTMKVEGLGELTVTRRKDWTTLEMGFVRGWVMCVKLDDAKVVASWPADTDHLRALGSVSDPGNVVVDLMKRQTFLYLDREDPRFAAMHQLVVKALQEKLAVAVAVAPGGEIIEDLQLA